MENNEKEEFIVLLEQCTPKYRNILIKKLRNVCKMNIRNKTKKYMKENNIKFKKCINCGDDYYIEIHHLDYSKPYIISPLCKKCHGNQHRINGEKVLYINLETGEKFYDKFRIYKNT